MIPLERLTDGSPTARNFDTLQRLVPDTGGISLRLRFGSVSSAGAVTRGTGFSASKTGTGTYTVTVGFDNVPVVLLTTEMAAGVIAAKVSAVSVASFSVVTWITSTAAAADAAFNWIAIG